LAGNFGQQLWPAALAGSFGNHEGQLQRQPEHWIRSLTIHIHLSYPFCPVEGNPRPNITVPAPESIRLWVASIQATQLATCQPASPPTGWSWPAQCCSIGIVFVEPRDCYRHPTPHAAMSGGGGSRKKSGPDHQQWEKEDVLQAVLLADSFNTRFAPLTANRPRVLLPIANTTLLDYTLEFLATNNVREVFVLCCVFAEQVRFIFLSAQRPTPQCYCGVSVPSPSNLTACNSGQGLFGQLAMGR